MWLLHQGVGVLPAQPHYLGQTGALLYDEGADFLDLMEQVQQQDFGLL